MCKPLGLRVVFGYLCGGEGGKGTREGGSYVELNPLFRARGSLFAIESGITAPIVSITAPMKATIVLEWPKLSATQAPAATAMESASASSQSRTH